MQRKKSPWVRQEFQLLLHGEHASRPNQRCLMHNKWLHYPSAQSRADPTRVCNSHVSKSQAHFTESPPSPTSLLYRLIATSPASPNLVSGFSLHPFESQYAFGDSNKILPKFFVFHEASQNNKQINQQRTWQIL